MSKEQDIFNKQRVHLLDVAHRYKVWLVKNGASDTYSVFCNGFGYEKREGEDRSVFHRAVVTIIWYAGEQARRMQLCQKTR